MLLLQASCYSLSINSPPYIFANCVSLVDRPKGMPGSNTQRKEILRWLESRETQYQSLYLSFGV